LAKSAEEVKSDYLLLQLLFFFDYCIMKRVRARSVGTNKKVVTLQ